MCALTISPLVSRVLILVNSLILKWFALEESHSLVIIISEMDGISIGPRLSTTQKSMLLLSKGQ